MFFMRRDFICWWIFLVGALKAVQGTVSNTKHITRYNKLCTSLCNTKYKGSYWCYTKGASDSWEYCFRLPNEDIEGKKCRAKCAQHGENYNWCWLVKGSWNYCGLVQNRLQRFKTRYGYDCIDDCSYYPSKGYYYCNANEDWDYCSPSYDATIYGKACKDNSKCASRGKSYTWCYTKDGSWDYCGIIQSNSCENTGRKRQLEEICMRNLGNRIDVAYHLQRGRIATNELDDDQTDSAHRVIADVDTARIPQQARSNVFRNDEFRIDMQGMVRIDGDVRYYNLQLQINRRRRPGESTPSPQSWFLKLS
ncbi:Hypothetical predicted protein [Paramuricea clavata]|uniref:Uncharacterized protein n=1 Tax=Paramuricea clavata TaxID=317549 RepID=A0A7D9IMG3_PARCT|nr:Hypothetical predicted protein [Paramuricea clavata]